MALRAVAAGGRYGWMGGAVGLMVAGPRSAVIQRPYPAAMTHPFRAAVESRDVPALSALLSPDVVFNSPVAFQPFRGREAVTQVLTEVMQVFGDFTYVDELVGEGTHALVFTATVDGRQVQVV